MYRILKFIRIILVIFIFILLTYLIFPELFNDNESFKRFANILNKNNRADILTVFLFLVQLVLGYISNNFNIGHYQLDFTILEYDTSFKENIIFASNKNYATQYWIDDKQKNIEKPYYQVPFIPKIKPWERLIDKPYSFVIPFMFSVHEGESIKKISFPKIKYFVFCENTIFLERRSSEKVKIEKTVVDKKNFLLRLDFRNDCETHKQLINSRMHLSIKCKSQTTTGKTIKRYYIIEIQNKPGEKSEILYSKPISNFTLFTATMISMRLKSLYNNVFLNRF